LLVLPLFIVDWLVYPGTFIGSRSGFGGWSVCGHLLFFLSGYLIFSNPRASAMLNSLFWPAAVGSVVFAVAFIPLIPAMTDWQSAYGTPLYALAQLNDALLTWCLLILFINLGSRFLNFKNAFLAYASDAVLPFYILHQTVIIVIGYYVVQWNLDPGWKYLIIVAIAFSIIMALYDLLVKRFNVMRFLFGMRTLKKAADR
jgi:surface polysaccharide O-acyltransferase-like enzyme